MRSSARDQRATRIEQPDGVAAAFGEFAGEVGAHAGISWPGATHPREYTVTGRSRLPRAALPGGDLDVVRVTATGVAEA